MKSSKIFMLAAFFIAVALASTAFVNTKAPVKKTDCKGFAVVELFTSEGCSSCPPADELVAKIQKEVKDKPVYILAYHVDYWNSLGWRDVFSNPEFSKRQRDYARYLHLESVYTPQIVVNGKTEFVGSEEGSLRSAIKNNLQNAGPGGLTLNAESINATEVNLKYAAGDNKNVALLIAILQKNAQTKVERGENGGRTLSHIQIVRQLQRVALNENQGQVSVALPKGFDSQNWEIIGMLQNTANGEITGATRAVFPNDINMPVVKNSK